MLRFNKLEHRLVPRHIPIRNEQDITHIFKLTNSNSQQLPIILRTDPIAKLIRLCPGNICKVVRSSSKCGEYTYFRICK